MRYSTIPTPASLTVYLAGSPTKTRPDTPASVAVLRLYHPLLVHLHNLPREGTWIGGSTTTSRTLLLVEVSKATWRIPWRLYWPGFLTSAPGVGGFAARPASSGRCKAACRGWHDYGRGSGSE